MLQVIYTYPETRYIKKIVTSHVINCVNYEGKEYVYIPLTNIKTTTQTIRREGYQNSPDLDRLVFSADANKIWDTYVNVLTNDERTRSFQDNLSVEIILSKTAVVTNETKNGMFIFTISKQ